MTLFFTNKKMSIYCAFIPVRVNRLSCQLLTPVVLFMSWTQLGFYLFLSFITIRKQSCGKVMFLHLSVSHSVHRGVSASVHAGIHTPLGRHPPPPSRNPLGRQPPPPGQTPAPGQIPHPADGHCSRRYASYWNAFLFIRVFPWCTKMAKMTSWHFGRTFYGNKWEILTSWINCCVNITL